MLTFQEFLTESFQPNINDVLQIEGKKYIVIKVLPNGFKAEHYVIVGDTVEETNTITVIGTAMYIHKNVGQAKVFAMSAGYESKVVDDFSKMPATEQMKKAMK